MTTAVVRKAVPDRNVLAAIEGPEDAGGQRKRIELPYKRVGP